MRVKINLIKKKVRVYQLTLTVIQFFSQKTAIDTISNCHNVTRSVKAINGKTK